MSDILKQIGIQSIGFVAMGFAIISYQAKTRKNIIFLQATSSFLWGVHFILLQGWGAVAADVIAVIRGLLFAQKERKKWAQSVLIPASLILAFWIAALFSYLYTEHSWISFLPAAGMTCSTIALFATGEKKIRILSFLGSPIWAFYDVMTFSVSGVVCEIFTVSSIIIALIRFRAGKDKKHDCP